jgi:hypothetical protein
VLAGLVIGYLIIVELVNRWFYKKYDPTSGRKTT